MFQRPENIASELFGYEDAEIKTRVTQEARERGDRKARALGFRSMSDYLRTIFLVAVYGKSAVDQCHAERIRSAAQNWADSGFDPQAGGQIGGPQ